MGASVVVRIMTLYIITPVPRKLPARAAGKTGNIIHCVIYKYITHWHIYYH